MSVWLHCYQIKLHHTCQIPGLGSSRGQKDEGKPPQITATRTSSTSLWHPATDEGFLSESLAWNCSNVVSLPLFLVFFRRFRWFSWWCPKIAVTVPLSCPHCKQKLSSNISLKMLEASNWWGYISGLIPALPRFSKLLVTPLASQVSRISYTALTLWLWLSVMRLSQHLSSETVQYSFHSSLQETSTTLGSGSSLRGSWREQISSVAWAV